MQIAREYLFKKDARQNIFNGIELMFDAVSPTLGPWGRNVIIDMASQINLLTKDGVTVANEVRSPDKWTDVGCRLIREASQNVNTLAGDGTTSVIVMAHAMCRLSMEALEEQTNVIKVKRGIEKAVNICIETVKQSSIPISSREDFRKVAFISSQDDEIADRVTEVFMQSGEHGTIDIERSDKPGIEIEHADGFLLESGWIIPFNTKIIVEDVPVLVTDKKIQHAHEIVPLLEQLAKQNIRKLFVVCDDLQGEALGVCMNNIQQNAFLIVPIKAPSFGRNRIEVMRDIAAATGAVFVSTEENVRLDKVTPEQLGKARRVTAERTKTILVAPDTVEVKKRISDRADQIKELLVDTALDDLQREEIELRLACLTDGVSIIKFGAVTEVERHERKHRITDAKEAVYSAREEGITGGCGIAYLRCIKALDVLGNDLDKFERVGVDIVRKALRAVTMRVLEVAGIEDRELIVSRIIDAGGNTGYNFETGALADMIDIGVIEPIKVIRVVIENAASVAKNFLSLQVAMSYPPENPLELLSKALRDK